MTLFGFGLRLGSSFSARAVSSFVFFFVVLGASFKVQAATDYYYWATSTSTLVSRYTTPIQGCPNVVLSYSAQSSDSVSSFRMAASGFSGTCVYKITGKAVYGGGVTEYLGQGLGRYGSSCITGSTYNAVTGACDAPSNKCAILKGTAIPSFKFKSTTDSPSSTISKNGCAVNLGTGICVTRTAPLFDCTFTGVVTGELLEPSSGQETGDCTGTQCTQGQPQKEVKDDPCAAIPAGSGFTCTATKSEDNPGKSQCGTANGAFICVDNPKPTSNVSKSDISQAVTNNADGSTTTKTTTTTTTTDCKGIGNCTTGTTTNVTTGGTNANGTNKPNSSTCTGPECGGGKVDAGTGAGDGTEDTPPEDESSVSGDMACAAVVACSGDVIQCAILRQEQQARCADEKFRDLSDGPVNDAKSAMATEFSASDYQPLKAQGDDVHDFSSVIKTDSFLSKSCPVLPSIDIPFAQFKTRLDFNMSGLCDFLTYLGYLNVAFALYKAAEIVGRGV
jgi:hypothetical protein